MIVDIENEESEKIDQTGKSEQVKTVSFPSTVAVDNDDSHINYLVFNAVKPMSDTMDMRSGSLRARRDAYVRASTTGNRTNLKEKSLAYIQLYMPSLNEELAHSYDKSESGFLTDLVNQVSQVASGNKDIMGEDGAMGSIGESALEAIKSTGASAVSSTLAQTKGKIYGEKSTGVYQETNLRTQQFTFRMIPKDLQELKAIGKIVHYFRKYSSPKLLSNTGKDGDTSYNTLEVPPIWYIEERVRDRSMPRYIPKFNFGPAVITSVNVNKTPDELYKYFDNTGGDPTSIEIQLGFQELIPVYQQYWEETDKDII